MNASVVKQKFAVIESQVAKIACGWIEPLLEAKMFPYLTRTCCISILILLGLFLCCNQLAYADTVTIGNGFGSKWGDPNHGTASDVITWSFMDDSTTLHATHPLILNGEVANTSETSNITSLRSAFDTANGVGSFDQAIEKAFETWAAAAPGRIRFQKIESDTGAPAGGNSTNNVPGSYAVDIRIGAFTPVPMTGFAGIGGVGYGPPGNDLNPSFRDALAGDIILNLSGAFFVAPGSEGDQFYFGGAYSNDLENLVLHELGHAAIGLAHSTDGPNFPGVGDVMFVGSFPDCCDFVNRQPSPQDVFGLQSVYGVPIPLTVFCTDFEDLVPAAEFSPIGEGWEYFHTNVAGAAETSYGGFAPQGPQISNLADADGDPGKSGKQDALGGGGNKYLNVYSDYNNSEPNSSLTNNVYQERTFTAKDAANEQTWTLSFDYAGAEDPFGVGDVGSATTAAFVRVLDGGFNVLAESTADTSSAAELVFAHGKVSVTFDADWTEGGIVQFGFTSTRDGSASPDQSTGVYYDDVCFAVLGDANGDGVFNNFDIASFVLALTNLPAYQSMFPNVDPNGVLDMNCDGLFDNLDISSFVAALTGS